MKETTKMSRAVCQLEKMYNVINADLFDNVLPVPIITCNNKKGSYGHCTNWKKWSVNYESNHSYELNINPAFFYEGIECVLDTMIHEMIHVYCRVKDIKETSRNGVYHNKKFKELAEQKHLKVFYNEKCGYNTTHIGNDELTEYALEKGFNDIKINDGDKNISNIDLPTLIQFGSLGSALTSVNGRRPSSTRKYKCPCCGNSVRATKEVRILCMDCGVQMIKE